MLTKPIGYRGGIKIRVVGVGDCTAKDTLTWLPVLCLQEHSKMPKDAYHWSEMGLAARVMPERNKSKSYGMTQFYTT